MRSAPNFLKPFWLHVQVGFNKGGGRLGYSNPLSLTPDVRYINSQTNGAVRGQWLYRVEGTDTSGCVLPPRTGAWRPHVGCTIYCV